MAIAISNRWTEYRIVNKIPQGMCHDLYGDAFCEAIGLAKIPELENYMGGTPSLTYAILRQYAHQASLKWHRDRWACEFSATVQVSKTPWPMHFAMNGAIGGQWRKDSSIILQQGDAILYRGCEVFHSRDKLRHHRSRHLFLHYVEQGSSMDNKDGRREYGKNNKIRGLKILSNSKRGMLGQHS